MQKRALFAAISAAVLVSASYIGYRQVSNSSADDLFMANVEALSSNEKPKPATYSSFHYPCYELVDYGQGPMLIDTGNYSASCFTNPNSTNTICHSHSCESCKSDPGDDID